MKYILSALLSFYSVASFACTDFSGQYLDDNSVPYIIKQNECSSLQIGNEQILADNIIRIKDNTDTLRISTSASFIEYYLSVENIVEYKKPFPPGMPIELIPAKFIILYTIDWKGNLAIDTTVYNADNGVISSKNIIHQKM